MVDEIRAQRDRLVDRARRRSGTSRTAAASNFVLFGGVDDPHATFQALLDHGVLIRDVGIPGHLRVTAGTEAETTAFLDGARLARSHDEGVAASTLDSQS